MQAGVATAIIKKKWMIFHDRTLKLIKCKKIANLPLHSTEVFQEKIEVERKLQKFTTRTTFSSSFFFEWVPLFDNLFKSSLKQCYVVIFFKANAKFFLQCKCYINDKSIKET